MYGVMLSSPSTWGWLGRSAGGVLVVALCMGTVTLPGVWAATFYVDDDTGDDLRDPNDAQNPSTPWQSISRALGEPTLAPGDTIQVAAGTYDQALGETFPLALVDGVALIGDPNDPNSRVISGTAMTNVFHNDDTALTAGTRLTGFQLSYDPGAIPDRLMRFDVASVAMVPEIRGNMFVGDPNSSDIGISVEDRGTSDRSFTALVENNSFVDLGDGVIIEGEQSGTADLSPTIRDNTFTGCNYAIHVDVSSTFSGTVSPVIFNNTATGSQFGDVYVEVSLTGGHGPTVAPLIANNTFTGAGSDSVDLSMSGTSLSSSGDTVTISPTILNNTITDAGSYGIEVTFSEMSTGVVESELTIAGNTITNPASRGIYVEMTYLSDADGMLVDWTISNNTVTAGAAGGGGIEVEGTSYLSPSAGGHFNLTVSGNTVTGAAYEGIDIAMSEFYYSPLSLSYTVSGNTVTGATGDGMYVFAGSLYSAIASRADVLDNVSDGNGGTGLDLRFRRFGSDTSWVQVACNTVVNNGGDGVRLRPDPISPSDPNAPPPDFGGGDLMSPGLNTFSGNGATDGYDFFNEDPNDVSAQSNWWGTSDTGVIDANIWDSNDDPTKGTVDFSGYLSGAPTVSATATLTDALQVDLAPAGPSYGDTIRYTATLEGTGDCGCASALFTAPIPANAAFVPDSLTASRGIVINERVSAGHPALIVGLGALAAGETVTITWDVVAGQGCCLTSQATLSCHQLGDLLTDDPDTPGGTDPTTVDLPNLFCDGFESGDTTEW